MAITQNTYTGNGSNKLFSVTFPYLDTSDIDVYLNGVLQTITTQYTFANVTTVEFVTAPTNGAIVTFDRTTDDSDNQATFFPGSSIRASDLNLDFDQLLYLAQELENKKLNRAGDTMSGPLNMGGYRIINVGDPVNLQDAATKVWVSNLAFTGVNLPDFQFDGGFANSTYGGTFLFLDGGNA